MNIESNCLKKTAMRGIRRVQGIQTKGSGEGSLIGMEREFVDFGGSMRWYKRLMHVQFRREK